MPRVVRPDDDAARYDAVWLGPDDITLPIQARYVSWGLWLISFLILIPIYLATVAHITGKPGSVMWAFVSAVILAKVVMLAVDMDRPLRAFLPMLRAEASAISRREREQTFAVSLRTVRIRTLGRPAPATTTPETP